MINNISNYAESIVILIIALTIVEMILPNNKNKKYIMLVSSIIVMLGVINPIIKLLNSEFDLSEEVISIQNELNNMEYKSYANYDLNYNIYNVYIENMKTNMIQRLEDMGYKILETKIIVDEITYEPTNIEMKVKYDDGYIQPIVIDVFGNNQSNNIFDADVNKIKEILSTNYGVDKNKIKINEE